MKQHYIWLNLFFLIVSCNTNRSTKQMNEQTKAVAAFSDYEGKGSVTQGRATTDQTNIYECDRGRKAGIGTIYSTDGKAWTVPAKTHFLDADFPVASDLHNPCNGNAYASAEEAMAKLDGSDIVEIDSDGSIYTAFIFGDNYFEMYINGIPVGKDNVPFTQFNSNIIRFKVNKPFTIAMQLIDWEENLGLGTENMRGNAFHPGDGGMVAVIKDAANKVVAITNESWKAQTFYIAPIRDLTCIQEVGGQRLSIDCDQKSTLDREKDYALHWERPEGWQLPSFEDADWPDAVTYTNETIGVDNKKSYTNFREIFDNKEQDAQFIWSSNVVLDNEVLVRYTIN